DLIDRYHGYARRAPRFVDFVDWAKAAGYPSPLAGRYGNTMVAAPPVPRRSAWQALLEPFRAAGQWMGLRVPVPAPLFIAGAELVEEHSRAGPPAFLLGRYSDRGWWCYFPVVLFFKSPLPFLILALT